MGFKLVGLFQLLPLSLSFEDGFDLVPISSFPCMDLTQVYQCCGHTENVAGDLNGFSQIDLFPLPRRGTQTHRSRTC